MTFNRTRHWALLGAALLASLGFAGAAQAGVAISVGIPLGGYVAPAYAAPVYAPAPAYVPPPVVYSQPAPVVYAPAPVYYPPAPVYSAPVYLGARFGYGWGGHHHGWR